MEGTEFGSAPVLPARFYSVAEHKAWVCGSMNCYGVLALVGPHEGKNALWLPPEWDERKPGVYAKTLRSFARNSAMRRTKREARSVLNSPVKSVGDITRAMTALDYIRSYIKYREKAPDGNNGNQAVLTTDYKFPVLIQCPCQSCKRVSKIPSVMGIPSPISNIGAAHSS